MQTPVVQTLQISNVAATHLWTVIVPKIKFNPKLEPIARNSNVNGFSGYIGMEL